MKSEEFKYFVINTAEGWNEGFSESMYVNPKGELALRSLQQVFPLGEIKQPTGFTLDRNGTLFVIDAAKNQQKIYTQGTSEDDPVALKGLGGFGDSPGQFKFCQFTGLNPAGRLAVGKSTLYVADTYNNRIQAFLLPGFQIRYILGEPSAKYQKNHNTPEALRSPKDIVIDSCEDLYILDYGNKVIKKFDRLGRFLGRIQNELIKVPQSIAIDKEDSLYVIDGDSNQIVKIDRRCNTMLAINPVEESNYYRITEALFKKRQITRQTHKLVVKLRTLLNQEFQSKVGFLQAIQGVLGLEPSDNFKSFILKNALIKKHFSGIAVDHLGQIYVGESGNSDNLKIYTFDQQGRFLGSFGKYSRVCHQLMVDYQGNLFANCGNPGRITLLTGAEMFSQRGVYFSKSFDSFQEQKTTQWHRIVLNARIFPKTKINVFYHVSDDARDSRGIPQEDWTPVLSSPRNGLESNDGLFFDAFGRFLNLKIEMFGDQQYSPCIKDLQIYFPRRSFLRYLPGTYQEDQASKAFLEHFLSLFESFSYGIENEIAQMPKYFDPQAAPADFLNWLGSWLAIARDDNWAPERKRELIARAYDLYKIRGTVDGMKEIVKLYTDADPILIEHFRLKTPLVIGAETQVGVSTVVGRSLSNQLVLEETSTIGDFTLIDTEESADKPFQANAFDFTLFANTTNLSGNHQIEALYRIIDEEKPAFTRCFVRTAEAGMRLGYNSYLEIDTVIPKGYPAMRLGQTARLGKDTFLATKYPVKGQIGGRSKIAIDTILH